MSVKHPAHLLHLLVPGIGCHGNDSQPWLVIARSLELPDLSGTFHPAHIRHLDIYSAHNGINSSNLSGMRERGLTHKHAIKHRLIPLIRREMLPIVRQRLQPIIRNRYPTAKLHQLPLK